MEDERRIREWKDRKRVRKGGGSVNRLVDSLFHSLLTEFLSLSHTHKHTFFSHYPTKNEKPESGLVKVFVDSVPISQCYCLLLYSIFKQCQTAYLLKKSPNRCGTLYLQKS